ncbi:MAG: restriction endonuclease [Candidatus Cryosericum sp.]
MPDVAEGLRALAAAATRWIAHMVAAVRPVVDPFVPAFLAAAALIVLMVVLAFAMSTHRERAFHGTTIRSIDAMSGDEFEAFLCTMFAHEGYRVQRVGASHDFGADLLLHSRHGRIAVQAKRYDAAVGIGAVQEVLGAIQYYQAERGIVVTNSRFTPSATKLAARSGIELWDREQLIAALGHNERAWRPRSRKASSGISGER